LAFNQPVLDLHFATLTTEYLIFLQAEGVKIPIVEIAKAATIKLCSPGELTEFECAEYKQKQTNLNLMGVTELLATVISGLNYDVSDGGLPNSGIELFNELMNGGNEQVQETLIAHLLRSDPEGKLKTHVAKRLDKALQGITASRKNGLSKSENDDDDEEDCEHAICTGRFMQLLCSGMHTKRLYSCLVNRMTLFMTNIIAIFN
jgi:hypothetical protein